MSVDERRLRVVVFTGGAVIEDDCAKFIAALESRPEVEVVGVFCESAATGLAGVLRDLWMRRRWLAPLLFMQRIVGRGAHMVTAPRAEVARRRSLRRLDDRIHFEANLHAADVLSRVARLHPDLGAVYGGPILRPELFRTPRLGTLGIHHGRLPEYRGKKTTFWAMYNGEETVGVAIQRIGTGLDRGEVLKDAVLPVGYMPLPVVRRRLERLGLELYVEAVLSMRRETPAFRPQPAGGGALYKDPRAGDVARFWLRYFNRLLRPTATRGIDS
ncbi:MAG TPA: formyltransferase family protein [Woeseiaceae bacterium]